MYGVTTMVALTMGTKESWRPGPMAYLGNKLRAAEAQSFDRTTTVELDDDDNTDTTRSPKFTTFVLVEK
jgi:hypothetical protein